MPALKPVYPKQTKQSTVEPIAESVFRENPFLGGQNTNSPGIKAPMKVKRIIDTVNVEPVLKVLAAEDFKIIPKPFAEQLVTAGNAFGIVPGMFDGALGNESKDKIPRLLDTSYDTYRTPALNPMVPLENGGIETVRKSWTDANKKIAQDINARMKAFFKGLNKKNPQQKALEKKKVEASVWIENLNLVTASASFGINSKTWTSYLDNDTVKTTMRDVFASLTDQGFGWYSKSPLVDLYKKDGQEIAVYSNDGTTLCITAFTRFNK